MHAVRGRSHVLIMIMCTLTVHGVSIHTPLVAEEKAPLARRLRELPAVLLGVRPGGEKSEKGGSTRHGGT
jgi:hypothetical protein